MKETRLSLCFLAFLMVQFSAISSQGSTDSSYPFDIKEPLVRLSPALKQGSYDDQFGYSAVAHQLVEPSSDDSYLTALKNTVIMVGAPYGKFPGGISNISYNGLACRDRYMNTLTDEELLALPDENITQCYKDLVPGLVYTCPLSTGDCTATLGTNNATSPDGLLFDRVGNVRYLNPVSNSPPELVYQNKSGQLMGSMLYSTNEYFVACAPLWEYASIIYQRQSQPLGRCVYSPRNLTGFTILQPCIPETSNNQNLESFCILGTSVHISSFKNESNGPLLAAGSPARYFSSGGVYYFNNIGNLSNLIEGEFLDVHVPASHGSSPTERQNFLNVNGTERQTYYGSFVTSGYITKREEKNFIVSSPRSNTFYENGRVFIIEVLNEIPTVYIEGEEFAEYFGNSVAAVDLNGDGWDDLVVGAPMYSEPSEPEIGRIYVYINNNGKLNKTGYIKGAATNGRFGYSIDSIGDINDDGFEDFAVGAPFEDSGVVYIYYGQAMDSNGRIVNPQYAQRIDGGSFVDRVSNLTEVSMFGVSISGNKDVDNNQYRDLVIGAYGTQSVFTLRSRPSASINTTIAINTGAVSLISYTCSDMNNAPATCFVVTVCAYYDSPTLEGAFAINYTLSEVIKAGTPQRLYFSNYSEYSVTRQLQFSTVDIETCDNVTVYVLNSTVSLDFQDFELSVEMQQVIRPDVVVDTNLVPSDLAQSPRIIAEPISFNVPVDSQCGEDNVCDLDLSLTHINSTFLGLDGEQFSEQSYLTLDAVSRVDIYLSYANLGEDVFGYQIAFPLPRKVFIHRLVLPQSSFFTCNDTTSDNSTHANLVCTDQRPFLSKSTGDVVIHLRWAVSSDLQSLSDIEQPVSVPITVSPDPTDSRNRENNTVNNKVSVNVELRSVAVFRTFLSFEQERLSYQANGTGAINSAADLGEENRLSVNIINDGPSIIYNANLVVYIPARSEETGSNYYYYPTALRVTSGVITCNNKTLDPDGLTYDSSSLNTRRRKRSLVTRERPSIIGGILTRQPRQASSDYNLDCSADPELCLTLNCSVMNIQGGSAALDVIGFMDERFYNRKSDTFNLRAYATVTVTNDFINTNGSITTNTADLVARPPVVTRTDTIRWYYIAPPAVGVLLIIILLAVILYFVGFFRRKKHSAEEDAANEDKGVEQFIDDPFGDKKPK